MTSHDLFKLSGAESFLPEVEEWLSGEPAHLYSIAREWFNEIRACGEDVAELLHDGCPTACVDDAAFCYVNVYKQHVNVGFYAGAYLDDPDNLLQGSGKRMRHVKILPGEDINSESIKKLIASAYAELKSNLK